MTVFGQYFPTFLVLLGQSNALALPSSDWEVESPANIFPRDPFQVHTYASLGESFASGPSAGDSYDNTQCRRYKKAFGPQVAEDNRLQGPKPVDFSFIACSGSRTRHIYEDSPGSKREKSQASQLKDKNPDLVTLSIGGNDIGFVELLDRCVYRFYQNKINTCGGCNWWFLPFDDCTNDCNSAMKTVGERIDKNDFSEGLTLAIKSILENAPRTKLFVTGYPEFWNDKTDYCDGVSFKLNCPENNVLPLIKARRQGMNYLTWKLNDKIKTIINNWPTGADIHYVDVNAKFKDHRFCEEGVREPSYRNPNIWFYPLEYWTGGTVQTFDGKGKDIPSGDCNQYLYDDQADYIMCLMAKGVVDENTSLDFNNMTNNVPGDEKGLSTQSNKGYPDWVARVFHPNINGMSAYRDAIIEAYNNYSPRVATLPKGKALAIGMMSIVNSHSRGATVDNNWHFYLTKIGHGVECDEKSDLVQEISSQGPSDTKVADDVKEVPFPGGSFKLDVGGQECEYKSDGTNPGRLFCKERQVECKEDTRRKDKDGAKKCSSSRQTFQTSVFCEF
ncbi:unnamed protein product [Periconia digitata]|uniref:SGNH hydrolase-type esterase domain-containing protein n=1 Tax=Periconia digitata TaxID=1303443 RepID=A0A9W4XQ68_9PLEO|nr:unnamed protein product [Periconia digitata]